MTLHRMFLFLHNMAGEDTGQGEMRMIERRFAMTLLMTFVVRKGHAKEGRQKVKELNPFFKLYVFWEAFNF